MMEESWWQPAPHPVLAVTSNTNQFIWFKELSHQDFHCQAQLQTVTTLISNWPWISHWGVAAAAATCNKPHLQI
jgi:hypothetical protein